MSLRPSRSLWPRTCSGDIIEGRAGNPAFLGETYRRILAEGLHQVKVEQLDHVVEPATLCCKHIGGFDVTMNEADLMSLAQCLADLPE